MTAPAMVVLRPGDKVLLTLAEDPDPEGVRTILQQLCKSFPGVDFTIMSGVSALAVAAPT